MQPQPFEPLRGTRILEFAGLGAAPFGVMLLAQLGAEVIRIDRVAVARGDTGLYDHQIPLSMGRRSIALDIRTDEGKELALRLAATSDVLVESHRPGVMERLGLGPEAVFARKANLIYARVTGYGQHGQLSMAAGHDINYLAVTGMLGAIGDPATPPRPPLNIVADYAGGGYQLAVGVLAAATAAAAGRTGLVLDVSMTDGVLGLMTEYLGLLQLSQWEDARGANMLDGAAPFYTTYQTADSRYLAVGAIEPKFYAAFVAGLGLRVEDVPQHDRGRWPAYRRRFAECIATADRDEWVRRFTGVDSCVSPVLTLREVLALPHHLQRRRFLEHEGGHTVAATPTVAGAASRPVTFPATYGEHSREILAELGISHAETGALVEKGVVA